ncbi:site-2 protease family protein [Patescibacteria group bacterium]|nr:site-2 protease family protein [Patescibacteria group bacterium]
MSFPLIFAIASIFLLVVLHELGHFLLAKKFRVKVEEFGIGLPPRIVGRTLGDTLYSLNLLPIGAFVKLKGEEQRSTDSESFSSKPIWQRILIVVGGVASSWITAAFIFIVLIATAGIPTQITDDETVNIVEPQVQVSETAPHSPAEEVGLLPGDIILRIATDDASQEITKMRELQSFVAEHKGKEVTLTIQRGAETITTSLIPRVEPPKGEGSMGIVLRRVGFLVYPWYEAPGQGVVITGKITVQIFQGLGRIVGGQEKISADQFMGPIGVINVLQGSLRVGIANFLYLVALIAIFLAIFNTLPIPALDGGRIVFLVIEGIIRKPLPNRVVQTLVIASFVVLIPLIVWVTINDVRQVF